MVEDDEEAVKESVQVGGELTRHHPIKVADICEQLKWGYLESVANGYEVNPNEATDQVVLNGVVTRLYDLSAWPKQELHEAILGLCHS